MNKCLILFVEGDTEVEFYKRVVAKEVEQEFRQNGVSQIIHVKARHSIEDWFLYDAESIMGFLRLGKNTKLIGKSGYDKLQNLYKRANKVYFKGVKSNGMIDKLDINKIVNAAGDQLKPLYDVLGVNTMK